MGKYTAETKVVVSSFTRQADDEGVVIGHPETAVFLVLPPDAIELLDSLAMGKTINEVQFAYQEKYGEIPDLEDLLTYLEDKGFVYPCNFQNQLEPDRELACDEVRKQSTLNINAGKTDRVKPIHYHFANFPHSLAKKLFSRTALVIYGGWILLSLLAIAVEPSIVPSWDAYFFAQNTSLMILALVILDCVALFCHEMAHLIAARALGISCRLGIGHRLWMLVAETDMTGIWSIPRRQRYLPFLAGPLLDTIAASTLLLLLFAQARGWISLPLVIFQLSRAWLLNYLLGLLWQCYFFMRTDFYYVITNYYRCKSLMKDTEVFVWNQCVRLLAKSQLTRRFNRFRKTHWVDQSHIPVRERRVIRLYATLWGLGRIAAIYSLIFITLPLVWRYSLSLLPVLRSGYQAHPYAFLDALLMIMMVCIPQGIGLWLWLRNVQLNPSKL
jgi:putative peptide zinc metalloprotease protein